MLMLIKYLLIEKDGHKPNVNGAVPPRINHNRIYQLSGSAGTDPSM